MIRSVHLLFIIHTVHDIINFSHILWRYKKLEAKRIPHFTFRIHRTNFHPSEKYSLNLMSVHLPQNNFQSVFITFFQQNLFMVLTVKRFLIRSRKCLFHPQCSIIYRTYNTMEFCKSQKFPPRYSFPWNSHFLSIDYRG